MDDLGREGALALLDAARRFDPSMGTKLLLCDLRHRDGHAGLRRPGLLSLSLPLDRYRQLRQVAFLCHA